MVKISVYVLAPFPLPGFSFSICFLTSVVVMCNLSLFDQNCNEFIQPLSILTAAKHIAVIYS